MAKPDKLFGQVRNDPLGAAVETRRNPLNEGSDLCDLHDDLYFIPANANRAVQQSSDPTRIKTGFNKPPTEAIKKTLQLPWARGQPEPSRIRPGLT